MIVSIITMIGVLFIKQFDDPRASNKNIHIFKDYDFDIMVDCMNITLCSYGYLIKLFPVYAEMK